jgi:hypothetical protein
LFFKYASKLVHSFIAIYEDNNLIAQSEFEDALISSVSKNYVCELVSEAMARICRIVNSSYFVAPIYRTVAETKGPPWREKESTSALRAGRRDV